jgi:hypothetical protein
MDAERLFDKKEATFEGKVTEARLVPFRNSCLLAATVPNRDATFLYSDDRLRHPRHQLTCPQRSSFQYHRVSNSRWFAARTRAGSVFGARS